MTMMRLRREDPRVVGSFRLHRRLGTGGMGVVYLGSDRRGQRVALKLIRSELAEDPEFRTRFAREVSAASRIRGGCTARLVAADIAADRPWLATQYVPGPSLYDKVNDQGPLAAAEVAAIGAALAEGLIAVHEAGVVHRDLKPSNILLSPKGPRIIDFGIAWATGASTLTHVGTAVGSPGFLAPEQVRGAPVTPATDVFALGATLAYAATADSPFGHGSSEVMLYRVVHEEPDLRGVPAALSPLVAACLVKDPEERPSTASLHERLTEIHAREARGLDPAWGAPGTRGPARPGGREAAAYLRQRTEERRGGSPPTRPTAAHRPPAGSQHLPGARPGQGGQSTQGRPASGGDRPGPTAPGKVGPGRGWVRWPQRRRRPQRPGGRPAPRATRAPHRARPRAAHPSAVPAPHRCGPPHGAAPAHRPPARDAAAAPGGVRDRDAAGRRGHRAGPGLSGAQARRRCRAEGLQGRLPGLPAAPGQEPGAGRRTHVAATGQRGSPGACGAGVQGRTPPDADPGLGADAPGGLAQPQLSRP
ncbi:serine/threonine-protein kinase [Wenjunlia vitaminophila]|uniref:serine/threonine-protein kinase n=1 Tax=Wenjunlia vitaminophila TaxID=76728 RepID=UPI001EEDDD1C|nr:serine/threonine-protein kinase [Wenjunlia vitaminophila]